MDRIDIHLEMASVPFQTLSSFEAGESSAAIRTRGEAGRNLLRAAIRQISRSARAGDIDICASRANRIIYHDDGDNVTMKLNEDFADLITEAKVFLISGFNAIRSEEILADRLASLLRIMAKLPQAAQVFFEDAWYYDPSFHELIRAVLVEHISIFSLNEDELQGHLLREVDRDNFTVKNCKEIESLSPNQDGAIFADALKKLLADKICCVPVAQVEQSNATTVGLGDAFVGGFLPALLP